MSPAFLISNAGPAKLSSSQPRYLGPSAVFLPHSKADPFNLVNGGTNGAVNVESHQMSKCDCGLENPRPQDQEWNRIMGGRDTKPNQYPWMVMVHMGVVWPNNIRIPGSPIESSSGSCAGSIISTLHILSAAHCFDAQAQQDPNTVLVVLGAHHTKHYYQKEKLKRELEKTPRRIAVHQMYNPDDIRAGYDIAILTLESPINMPTAFSHIARPICLPVSRQRISYENHWAIAAGWGVINGTGL